MATVSENLQELVDTTALIKTALRNKGAEVSDALIDVPSEVESIQTGGSPVLDTLNVSANGTYTPPAGTDGYDEVVVAVPGSSPVLQTKTITANGTYTPDSGYDGFSQVEVDVQQATENVSIKINFAYTGSDSTYTNALIRSGIKAECYKPDGTTEELSGGQDDGLYRIYTVPKGSYILPLDTPYGWQPYYTKDGGTTWEATYTQFKPTGTQLAPQLECALTDDQTMTFNVVKNNE